MSLEILWFIIVAVFWTGFFVLEGFDFGVGVLHKVVGRSDVERRVAINAIGPVWDGNEVWLIVGGAAIFAAFPSWYATWFSAGYLALFLVLVALIIRGVSFEWRAKVDTDRWRGTWSWTLTFGSVLVPLLFGVALGDLLAGLPVNSSQEFTGSFWDLLTPYGLWLGLTLLALCLLHGATFLALKTDGAVRLRAQGIAARLAWPAALLVAAYAVSTVQISDAGPWRILAAAVPVAAALAAALLIRWAHQGRAFAATAITIGGTIAALFANLYPNVMVSSTSTANNLTVPGTAASDYALKVMTVVALVMTPVVVLYQGWSYWVFRARIAPPLPSASGLKMFTPGQDPEWEDSPMATESAPRVLLVYFTMTKQVGRVVDAIAGALEANGCQATKAFIEFTDERWVPKLSQFPMKRPMLQIGSIFVAQIRHKTGEIHVPPEAMSGIYDLVVVASPTWWFQTSMPIRTYLETPEARAVMSGKPFACVSVSRRYFSINLGQMRKMGEHNGGRQVDKTHFVVAGGQVKSMLSWLGYMKHGQPQERVLGLKMPAPNLQPDFDEQARGFVDDMVAKAFEQPSRSQAD